MSFDAAKVLGELPEATGVMKGEGEETFAQLAGYYVDKLCKKGTDSRYYWRYRKWKDHSGKSDLQIL